MTDLVAGLIWLEWANCLPRANWEQASEAAALLGHGESALTDHSLPGDWRLRTREEWGATIAEVVGKVTIEETDMSDQNDSSKGRRAFLAGTSALASGTLLHAVSAQAKPSRYAQSLRLFAEGDARADWVLSLLPVPAPPSEIPVRARYRFPAIAAGHADKDVMSVRVYMQRGADEIPISAFLVAVEHVAIAKAAFGGDDNPENNLMMSGRVVAVDPDAIQPFGDLVGRAFGLGCGFLWDDARRSAAVFKLLAGTASGSHVTVLPEADGFIEIDRPWDSF